MVEVVGLDDLFEHGLRSVLDETRAGREQHSRSMLVPLRPFKTLRYIFGNPEHEHKPKAEAP